MPKHVDNPQYPNNISTVLAEALLSASKNPLTVNGSKIDGRTALAQNYRETCIELVRQYGDAVTYAELILIKQAAALKVALDSSSATLMQGGEGANDYVRMVNALRGIFKELGLSARLRDVTPGECDRPGIDAHTAELIGGGA
ncbi:hypothetical protein [Caenispirillum bisanense]|uniref:Phage terminase, small subunit, putative, P27 family n=1 Tax=Caenispirillum bisanense TaxID=414052 RepID=A0A286GM58_9PROT|nr:hypothetical protein [Caenispirillum bisanense]SOD96623.1 hypothetical protein SAMN05421508_1069 [Caenispirillum bisanense]